MFSIFTVTTVTTVTTGEDGIMKEQTALQLLQEIYRNDQVPLHVRMRPASIAIQHETPKLAAVAHVGEGMFGDLLDKAIERSHPKLIEFKPEPANAPEQHPASELRKPMAKLRRY